MTDFSIKKRLKSFAHAGRGLRLFLGITHNAWVHTFIFVIVVLLGLILGITSYDWIAVLLVSGMVFVTEALNTAIEIHMNLTSPEQHPYARDTKDIAASAVLIASIVAALVGLIIFLPYIF